MHAKTYHPYDYFTKLPHEISNFVSWLASRDYVIINQNFGIVSLSSESVEYGPVSLSKYRLSNFQKVAFVYFF